MSSPELVKAKKELYTLLLQKRHRDLSSEEVEIMFSLSQDGDIKSLLRDRLKREVKPDGEITQDVSGSSQAV